MSLEEQLIEASSQVKKAIKVAIAEKGFSQVELANLLGVSKASISRAINGDTNPQSFEIRKKLYKILGMK